MFEPIKKMFMSIIKGNSEGVFQEAKDVIKSFFGGIGLSEINAFDHIYILNIIEFDYIIM